MTDGLSNFFLDKESNRLFSFVSKGDLKNEQSVLEWLVDDDNRELDDEIEAVNHRMLDRLMETSPFLAVLFHDDECVECESILEGLENVDDEADQFGIDFVKNKEALAAKQYNVYHTPALVYFRKKVPIVYDGDLHDEEKVKRGKGTNIF